LTYALTAIDNNEIKIRNHFRGFVNALQERKDELDGALNTRQKMFLRQEQAFQLAVKIINLTQTLQN
jgi:hypothetical protein